MEKNDKHEQVGHELDIILQDLPWPQLNNLICQFKKSLWGKITVGGIRVHPNNRKWIQSVVKRESMENKEVCRNLFAAWFNMQKDYYDCLAPFFESEEHAELLKMRGVDDELYVMKDAIFQEFVTLVMLDDIDKFLLVSPIEFTAIQKEQLEEARNRQEKCSSRDQPGEDLEVIAGKSSKTAGLTKGEWKHHQKELKKCQRAKEELAKENQKLLRKMQDSSTVRADCNKKLADMGAAHAGEVKRLQAEIRELHDSFETLNRKAESAAKELEEKDRNIRNFHKKLTNLQSEKDLLFQKVVDEGIDAEDLLAGLNAPDDVLELLSTVIRPPISDDREGDKQSIQVQEFWQGLADKEKDLIENILELTVADAANEEFFIAWADRVDDFNDLKCSLHARYYLADMFYEILRQCYSLRG